MAKSGEDTVTLNATPFIIDCSFLILFLFFFQKFEFSGFPGPIVVTTNCIIEPRRMYKDRIYSINEVGVSGVKHLQNRDFSEVIAQAQSCKGFPRTIEPADYHTVGFNHRAVLPLAGDVIDAVQKGIISRIFLIGGCDGSQFDRK